MERDSVGVEFEMAIMDVLFGSLCFRDDPRIGSFQSLLGRRKRHFAMPDHNHTKPFEVHTDASNYASTNRILFFEPNTFPYLRSSCTGHLWYLSFWNKIFYPAWLWRASSLSGEDVVVIPLRLEPGVQPCRKNHPTPFLSRTEQQIESQQRAWRSEVSR